jgi:hypothetical protein
VHPGQHHQLHRHHTGSEYGEMLYKDGVIINAQLMVSSASSLHFQLTPACGLHEYTSQAALEHTQATITTDGV